MISMSMFVYYELLPSVANVRGLVAMIFFIIFSTVLLSLIMGVERLAHGGRALEYQSTA